MDYIEYIYIIYIYTYIFIDNEFIYFKKINLFSIFFKMSLLTFKHLRNGMIFNYDQ